MTKNVTLILSVADYTLGAGEVPAPGGAFLYWVQQAGVVVAQVGPIAVTTANLGALPAGDYLAFAQLVDAAGNKFGPQAGTAFSISADVAPAVVAAPSALAVSLS